MTSSISSEVANAGGVALGTFFSQLVLSLVKDHKQRTQEKAIKRLEEFSAMVDLRLAKLEFKMESGEPIDVEKVLEEPELAFTIQAVALAAARISQREKHEVLATALVERLRMPPEGVRALTAGRAIEIIPHLTPDQIGLLGLLSLVMRLRPVLEGNERLQSNRASVIEQWWTTNAGYYLPPVRINHVDYDHLTALGCLVREVFIARELKSYLRDADFGVSGPVEWDVDKFLRETPQGRMLDMLWPQAQRCNQTTVGHLIGQYFHAERSGESIDMTNWTFGADAV